MYRQGELLSTLFSPHLKRVVRVHCLFDTNAKLQITRRSLKNNGKSEDEIVFGSRELSEDAFEQRVLVFEGDFKDSGRPMGFTPAAIDNEELFDSEWFRGIMEK